MHQNIEIALMKTQSKAFRTSAWTEGSPSNRTMTPNHTARVAYTKLCECPCHPQPGIKPSQIFLEKPENVHLPHPTWQSLKHEEMRRRRVDNCPILMCKVCRIITQKAVKMFQLSTKLRVWRLMQYTYFSFFFFFFFYEVVTILILLCHYGVWSVD